MENRTITVNLENYKSLHKAYEDAVCSGKTGNDIIEWEGKELIVAYLYYLLSFFEISSPEVREYAKRKNLTRRKV